MKQIDVSVVMPAYNCENYIAKAIDSVLEQNVNLELIIINDCSKDNVDDVVNKYLDDPRIKYIHNKENLGVARTRNKGVYMAEGIYVAFLDSDDWWAPDKLEKQLKALDETDAVMCATARELMTAAGESTGRIIEVPKRVSYKKLLYGNIINCSSVLIEQKIMKKYDMKWDDAHEDYITWLSILRDYGDAVLINEPLLKYRLSEAGKSRNKFKSARMHYKSLRYMGFGRLKSSIYFIAYGFNGVKKHFFN